MKVEIVKIIETFSSYQKLVEIILPKKISGNQAGLIRRHLYVVAYKFNQ